MISVIIHTKNSANTLQRALDSVQWASEIVIVDMESQDNTLTIAQENHSKILSHKDVGYVEPARNKGLAMAKGPWILILDADEEIPNTLANKLQRIAKSDHEGIYSLPRKNIVFGQALTSGGWWPDYNIRFFRKGLVSWKDEIHSQPDTKTDITKLQAKTQYAIVHHHYETIEEYLDRLNRYTSIEAKSDREHISDPFEVFFDDLFRRYYQKEGYQDGEVGTILSLFQAHYQLVTYAKRRLAEKFKDSKQLDVVESLLRDWKYWHATMKLNTTSSVIGKAYWRVRRWLKI